MDTLPDSLLLEIFNLLAYGDLCLGVRFTCSHWHYLTHDPTLWKYVEVADHFTDGRFLNFIQQDYVRPNIESLECSKCENLTEDAFVTMSELEFPKLKHFAVPLISSFPDHLFEKLWKACPDLEELENLSATPEGGCHPLPTQMLFPKLKKVHDKPLSSYGRIRKGTVLESNFDKRHKWLSDLAEISSKCPNVTSYHCRRGIEYINDEGLEKVAVLFPKLHMIELGYCSITDKGLALFFENARFGLMEIILDKPGDISDKGLKIIADNCPLLEKIKVSRCLEVTDEGVGYLLRKCPNLRELHLNNMLYSFEGNNSVRNSEFSNECLKYVGEYCPKMIFFRVFHSGLINEKGIGSLLQGCHVLQGLMFYECAQIDDTCLEAIGKMPHLKALVMVGCNNITPKGIVDLVLVAPHLLRLTLFSNLLTPRFYTDMTDLGNDTYAKIDAEGHLFRPSVVKKITLKGVGGPFVQLLTVLCPDVHTIDLRDGCIINTVALCSVIRNCECLRVLDVQSLTDLKDSFIDTLCEHSLTLRKLGLGRMVENFSNEALARLVCECPSLTSISMDTKNTHVDEEMLMEITRAHHGGHCFLHVDYECRQPDNHLEENHRYVDLHFTPIKYLGSVPCRSDVY